MYKEYSVHDVHTKFYFIASISNQKYYYISIQFFDWCRHRKDYQVLQQTTSQEKSIFRADQLHAEMHFEATTCRDQTRRLTTVE